MNVRRRSMELYMSSWRTGILFLMLRALRRVAGRSSTLSCVLRCVGLLLYNVVHIQAVLMPVRRHIRYLASSSVPWLPSESCDPSSCFIESANSLSPSSLPMFSLLAGSWYVIFLIRVRALYVTFFQFILNLPSPVQMFFRLFSCVKISRIVIPAAKTSAAALSNGTSSIISGAMNPWVPW